MTKLVSELTRQPVTAEELKKWPLMHGTYVYGDDLRNIKANGLIAGRGTNSHNYDELLGRKRYVFLAPATFRLQYSGGYGAVLVEPTILNRNDLKFSDRDIDEVFDCLKILADDGGYCGSARNVPLLEKLVADARQETNLDFPEDLALAVLGTEQFKQYVSSNYELTAEELFTRIEKQAASCDLYNYFSRGNLCREEILALGKVEPEFLLGHWDNKNWTEWNRAKSLETQVRLEAWLQAASKYVWR